MQHNIINYFRKPCLALDSMEREAGGEFVFELEKTIGRKRARCTISQYIADF